MNQIEALQALAEGKRIRRKVWSNKDCFLEFNDKGELVDENGFFVEQDSLEFTVSLKRDLIDDDWELYTVILTKDEKEYLEYVLKPFKDIIKYVEKTVYYGGKFERLSVEFQNNTSMSFPLFEAKKYYKRVDTYKIYTLEELGLFEGE